MRKKLFLWISLCIFAGLFYCYNPHIYASGGVRIDKVSIPDEVFRTVVLKKVDVDKDSVIDEEEDRKTTKLVLASESDYETGNGGYLVTEGVKNLKGIDHFHYLENLEIWGDKDLKIDIHSLLEKCNSIKQLSVVGFMDLGDVIIPKKSQLETFVGAQGRITGLDVRNATNLQRIALGVTGNFEVDLSQNKKLNYIQLEYCGVKKLDFSNNPDMKVISTYSNVLNKIDITQCKKLKRLECGGKIKKLDLLHNKSLEELMYFSGKINELQIASKKITEIDTKGSKLKRIYINRSKKKVKITKDKCTKVIERIVKLPSKVKVSKKGKIVRWKKTKHAKKYQVFYAKKKNGTYKKMKTTSNRSYRLSKKGYIKVRGVTKGYGTNWYGKLSFVV